MMQVVKTVDRIYYNVPLPKEFLGFEIPPDSITDFSVHDDPNNGMSAEGLTHEQASVIIVRKYIEAVIAGDWETRIKLRPLAKPVGKSLPEEILEIGKPYSERGYTGLIVPCKVRKDNGELRKYKMVVRWRVIDNKPYCVIVALMGSEPVKGKESQSQTMPR